MLHSVGLGWPRVQELCRGGRIWDTRDEIRDVPREAHSGFPGHVSNPVSRTSYLLLALPPLLAALPDLGDVLVEDALLIGGESGAQLGLLLGGELAEARHLCRVGAVRAVGTDVRAERLTLGLVLLADRADLLLLCVGQGDPAEQRAAGLSALPARATPAPAVAPTVAPLISLDGAAATVVRAVLSRLALLSARLRAGEPEHECGTEGHDSNALHLYSSEDRSISIVDTILCGGVGYLYSDAAGASGR